MGGIPYVAAMIGFFGVAEALVQLRRADIPPIRQKVERIIPPWGAVRRHFGLTLRSSAIGVVVGALPGTGGDIAALLAYDAARRTVKNPTRPFGQGAEEGVVAPEAANNAAVGGAYIPMLTLGIPGDAVTAVIIGALFIHGLKPGPMLMIETPHLFWFTVGNLTLANIFLLVFGLSGIRLFAKLAEAPRALLSPLILVLSVVGTYAIQNSATDVLLDAGLRRIRLLPQDLWLRGRAGGAGDDPGAADGCVLPPGDDLGGGQPGGIPHGLRQVLDFGRARGLRAGAGGARGVARAAQVRRRGATPPPCVSGAGSAGRSASRSACGPCA